MTTYGIFNFGVEDASRIYTRGLVAKNRYTEDEMISAYRKPAILHCIHKPWTDPAWSKANLWWGYAEKTGYLEEIKAKYQIS